MSLAEQRGRIEGTEFWKNSRPGSEDRAAAITRLGPGKSAGPLAWAVYQVRRRRGTCTGIAAAFILLLVWMRPGWLVFEFRFPVLCAH